MTPIPPNTVQNIAGAIGDVFRAGAAWGHDAAKGEPTEQVYQMGLQFMVQCFALIMQREPTLPEIEMLLNIAPQ